MGWDLWARAPDWSELDQDVELPRHVRAAMAPGQDRIPIGGGEW